MTLVRPPGGIVNPLVGLYIAGMDTPALSIDDTKTLIAYARQKFAEERWPLAPSLRPIREALERLDPKLAPIPRQPARPYVPSSLAMRKKARRR